MKIAIIGHLKYPIKPPFAGGLEMITHTLASRLIRNGHEVTVYAAGDSDRAIGLDPVVPKSTVPECLRQFGCEDRYWIESTENRAYRNLMHGLMQSDYDVIHNNSISPIPLRYASLLPVPLITTLHVPVLPRMKAEILELGRPFCGEFVNVSLANMSAWKDLIPDQRLIYNGVDTDFWSGCRQKKRARAIYFGRILPDKGTHYAIEAAHRAGLPIDVVGPISDQKYYRAEVLPRLQKEDQLFGHRSHKELCRLISRAEVAVVSPTWNEPFGLVVAEAMACGTPVAGFRSGALPELITPETGCMADKGDVQGLADAIHRCRSLDGDLCRQHAVQNFSINAMMDKYERLYRSMVPELIL